MGRRGAAAPPRHHSADGATENEAMRHSARYVKIVERSEEDQCYVGSCPGLFLGGCHGDDERKVFEELCEIVEEVVALYRADGKLSAGCVRLTRSSRTRLRSL